MAIRVSKLLRDANIGLQTLEEILNALDFNDSALNLNTKIPDDLASLVMNLCYKDVDLLKLIEENASKKLPNSQQDSRFSLKIIGKIDLDELNNPKGSMGKNQLSDFTPKRARELYSENFTSYKDWIKRTIPTQFSGWVMAEKVQKRNQN